MAITPTDTSDGALRADATPMIDCVFLMIVFFVCGNFVQYEGKLKSWLPRASCGSSKVEPEPQLCVEVHCDSFGTERDDPQRRGRKQLDGHRVHWRIGPKPVTTMDAMQEELARLAADPQWTVRDWRQPGNHRLATCVVQGFPGTVLDDAVRAADACRAAGFTEVLFGGGIGPRPR
jgi:hypothetical protein